MPGTITPTKTPPKIKRDPKRGNGGVAFEQVEHIVRNDDPDTALCGVDQTDVAWDMGWPVCMACVAVAEGRMN
jgi:hypothetical protein